MNTKINKIMAIITVIILAVSVTIFVSLSKSTYSLSDKYVVFKGVGQHKGEILKSCKIGSDGKLSSSCVDEVGKICTRWSKDDWTGYAYYDDENNLRCTTTQNDQVTTANMKTKTFTNDDVYYCVACSSTGSYYWGCYVCNADSSIMKWVINSSPSDPNCPNNQWHKDTSITDDKQCPPPPPESACYQCKSDSHVMTWKTDGTADSKCSAGYTKTTKTQAECVTVTPACYQCKNDSHIMTWKYDGDADSKCSAGYTKTTKTQAECVTVTPACYECKTDSHVMYWKYDGNADANCSAGYTKTTKTQAECKSILPACYQCKANGYIMVWKYDATGDSSCVGGYTKTTKTQAECKSVSPACYQCKANKNIMKWKYEATGDSSCAGGYTKTTKTQAECKIIPENPPTGETSIILTWIVAGMAIGIAAWYLKKSV